MIDEFFTPAVSVIPMGWGATLGFGLLLLAALVGVGLGARMRAWLGLAAGAAVLFLPLHRFLRAIAPGDGQGLWTLVGVVLLALVVLTWLLREAGAAVMAWLAVGATFLLAWALDRASESLASVPTSWGLVLLLGALFLAWAKGQ